MRILLVVTFAAVGQPLPQRFLRTNCQIVSFSGHFDGSVALREPADADVVVGAPFTKVIGRCVTADPRWCDIAFHIDHLDVAGPLRNELRQTE
jgi:hypothetical protein